MSAGIVSFLGRENNMGEMNADWVGKDLHDQRSVFDGFFEAGTEKEIGMGVAANSTQ